MEGHAKEKATAFDIGHMRPEDASSIVDLCRIVYGDHYPIREMYDPQHLLEQQDRGEMHHIVARDRKNRLVGHMAIFHASSPYPGVWEVGNVMVLPEYRNSGLNNMMMEYNFTELIPRLGIEQTWGEVGANHVYMQKTGILLGAYETGIEFDVMPESSYEKEQSSQGRVSVVLMFKTFKPKPQTLFLPSVYDEIIRHIYANAFDFGHTYLTADLAIEAKKQSSVQSALLGDTGVNRITFPAIGGDVSERVRQIESEMTGRGAVVFQVCLKLTDPLVGRAVDALRGCGYFLGGVLPRWFDDDGIMMQKIIHEPNVEGVKPYTGMAKKLLEFIRDDRKKVKKNS